MEFLGVALTRLQFPLVYAMARPGAGWVRLGHNTHQFAKDMGW